ncbi:MAG TPA: TonB-dependent receptor [Gammaproteobacteria bacterium]|nr:TonB-dependent receptor [Gammaproteobacteria bacterium]
MNISRLRVAGAIAIGLAAALSFGTASAQDRPAESGGGLEEIVVTATRQSMNLQEVPLAVVAITSDSMARQGIENLEDINAVVPNVVIAGDNVSTDTANFTMRGIPNVGTYIDGIWQVSNSGLLLRDFVDIDRVEVLRGPQGTLYGRDSTGGAIRIYTKQPTDEFGFDVNMTVGSFDRRDVRASLDLPITDNFKSRWTLGSFDRDGYITSRTTGFKTGNYSDEVYRGDFLWEPKGGERVSLRFIAQSDTIVANAPRVQTWIEPQIAWNSGFQMGLSEAYDIVSGGQWNCNTACAGWPGGSLGKWESTSEVTVPSHQWLEQQSIDLKVKISDSVNMEYLIGHTNVDNRTYNDWDSGQFNFFIDYFNNETELTSHEFQFTGGNDRFTWVGGVYSWTQQGRSRNPSWSMCEWQEVSGCGEAQPYSYVNQILTSPSCTSVTPAMRGVDFSDRGLDPNSVNGWPIPCNATLSPDYPGLGWVGALASGARPPAGDRLTGNDIDGYAIFGEVVVGLTDKVDLTLGYRYHDQTAKQYQFDVDAGVAAGITAPKPLQRNKDWFAGGVYDGIRIPGEQEVSFDADTYRAAISWRFADNMMLYAGYTEGFNSGGLDTFTDSLGPVESQYDPERLKNHEIGLRTELLDRRLRLNATVFLTDWIGVQLPATIPDRATGQEITELVTQNAASAEAKGLEVEVSYAPTDNLLIDANLGWLDTRYTDSKSPAVTLNTEFSRAPDNTYNVGLQYTAHLGGGATLTPRLDASYTGPYWRSNTPSLRQNAYGVPRDFESGDFWLVNARLGFTPANGNYELSLFGLNLTDSYNLNSGFLHNIWQFDFATVDRPREVGVSLRLFFR